ncbi:hypothetical protein Tco_0281928 [Tanacetum coccineum]
MEECHKLLTDQVDDAIIRYNVSKPLPLGGEPGHITIQPDFFFNKDLEYLRYGRKVGRPALSISKMKATCYPDVGLGTTGDAEHRFSKGRHIRDRTGVQMIIEVQLRYTSSVMALCNSIDEDWTIESRNSRSTGTIPGRNTDLSKKDVYHGTSDCCTPLDYSRSPQGILVSFLSEINTILSYSLHSELDDIEKVPITEDRQVWRICWYTSDVSRYFYWIKQKLEMETPRSSRVNSPRNAHS